MASCPMRPRTSLSGGSMKGVTRPLRANSSQPIASPTIGSARAAPHATRFSTATRLIAPLQHPPRQKEIGAVSREAEECHRQHDRIHAIIGTAGTEKSDQIAKALLRNNKFRAHEQDKRQCERRANAVQEFRHCARQYDVA